MSLLAYAIPDLHGRHDLAQSAVRTISGRGGGCVVFLGDYIDRGPESRRIIEMLMAGPPSDQEWTILQGNHEMMCVGTMAGVYDQDWWLSNGGTTTVANYDSNADNPLLPMTKDDAYVLAEHARWMSHLPKWHETAHHVFVHAGLNPAKTLAEQTDEALQWDRPKPKDLDYDYFGKHVVHGHTPGRKPMLLRGRTNLDTRAYEYGVLHVGVFDLTAPGGPREIIEIRAEPGYQVGPRVLGSI